MGIVVHRFYYMFLDVHQFGVPGTFLFRVRFCVIWRVFDDSLASMPRMFQVGFEMSYKPLFWL